METPDVRAQQHGAAVLQSSKAHVEEAATTKCERKKKRGAPGPGRPPKLSTPIKRLASERSKEYFRVKQVSNRNQ